MVGIARAAHGCTCSAGSVIGSKVQGVGALRRPKLSAGSSDERRPRGTRSRLDGDHERDPIPGGAGMTSLAQRIEGREASDATAMGHELDPVGPSTRLGRYELSHILGRGTYGVVFAAYDPELDREVAIKVFNDADATAACRREAIALARAVHPNVVALHDFVCAEGLPFIVMDIVHGGTLHDYMQRWHDWREVVRLFIQAARGLAAVHAAGLAHGDVKPSNVLLGFDGRVQIADLGVACMSFDDDPPPGGTAVYMAPERLAGARASAAADQFSLCVALWETLYRVRPWLSNTAEIVGAVAPERARLRVDVPAQLMQVLRRGLAVDARQRHQDMGALADALTRVLLDAGRRDDRRWLLAAVVTAVMSILALTWLMTWLL
jgi:serine/threonine protein kinase